MEGAEAAAALAPADAEPQQQEEQAPAQAEQEQAPAQEQAEVHPDAGFANGEQVTQAEQPAPTGHSAPPVGTGREGSPASAGACARGCGAPWGARRAT